MAGRNTGKTRDQVVISIVLFSVVLHVYPRLAVGQPCAYVANLMSDTVSVIDTATNVVTATIPVGHNPNGIEANPRGGLVCVTNYLSNDVSLINPDTNTVVATVAVGAGPVGVGRTAGFDLPYPDPGLVEAFAYVANRNDDSVSVIEVGTAKVIATIGVDPSPDGVAVGYSAAYVTHSLSAGSVSVIDIATNTVTAKIPVGERPGRVALAPNGHLYVTNFGSFNVSVIDTSTNTVTATIGLSLKPSGIAVTPDGRSAYVTNFGSPIVSIIPVLTNTVVAAITVGAQPAAIAHIRNRGHGYTYVANSGSDSVSVIDRAVRNHVVATIPVGHKPFALAVGYGNCAAVPTVMPTAAPSETAPSSPTLSVTPTAAATPTSTGTSTPTATLTPTPHSAGGCAIGGATPGSRGVLWLIPLVALFRRQL